MTTYMTGTGRNSDDEKISFFLFGFTLDTIAITTEELFILKMIHAHAIVNPNPQKRNTIILTPAESFLDFQIKKMRCHCTEAAL